MRKLFFVILAACALHVSRAEEDPFRGHVELGFTKTDGNSETEAITLGLAYKRAWNEKNEFMVKSEYNHGEAEDVKNVDNGKAEAQYNRFLTERLYGHFHSSYEMDDIADLDHRLIVGLGPGLGVVLIDGEEDQLNVQVGLSYFDTKQANQTENGVLMRVAQNYEHRFNGTARFVQTLEYLPVTEEFSEYLLNATAAIESGFTKRLAVRIGVERKYNSAPEGPVEKTDLIFKGGVIFRL